MKKPIKNLTAPFDAYDGTEPYLFVSYAHKDSLQVFHFLCWLTNLGYRIWYDEGIDPGRDWGDHIASALASCEVMLLFVSQNAVRSKNVGNEVRFALKHKIPILRVNLQQGIIMPLSWLSIRRRSEACLAYKKGRANPAAVLPLLPGNTLADQFGDEVPLSGTDKPPRRRVPWAAVIAALAVLAAIVCLFAFWPKGSQTIPDDGSNSISNILQGNEVIQDGENTYICTDEGKRYIEIDHEPRRVINNGLYNGVFDEILTIVNGKIYCYKVYWDSRKNTRSGKSDYLSFDSIRISDLGKKTINHNDTRSIFDADINGAYQVHGIFEGWLYYSLGSSDDTMPMRLHRVNLEGEKDEELWDWPEKYNNADSTDAVSWGSSDTNNNFDFCVYRGWLYCEYKDDDLEMHSIDRIHLLTGEAQRLCSFPGYDSRPARWTIDSNKLFYTNMDRLLCYIDLSDFTHHIIREEGNYNSFLQVSDGWVFTHTGSALVKVNVSTGEEVKLIEMLRLTNAYISNGWIYCYGVYVEDAFRIRTDGTEKQMFGEITYLLWEYEDLASLEAEKDVGSIFDKASGIANITTHSGKKIQAIANLMYADDIGVIYGTDERIAGNEEGAVNGTSDIITVYNKAVNIKPREYECSGKNLYYMPLDADELRELPLSDIKEITFDRLASVKQPAFISVTRMHDYYYDHNYRSIYPAVWFIDHDEVDFSKIERLRVLQQEQTLAGAVILTAELTYREPQTSDTITLRFEEKNKSLVMHQYYIWEFLLSLERVSPQQP